MKRETRLISFLLILLFISFTITGCADKTGSNETTTNAGTDAETEFEISDNLPESDFEGYEFRMLIRDNDEYVDDMYSETETGDLMEDAIYYRNLKISERFNINYRVIRSSNNNYETDGVNSIIAGSDDYDIIMPHARAAFAYAQQQLLLEWTSDLEYVDLDMPWWAQDAKESFSINHKLYCMVGDISYKNLSAATCILFNKLLFDNYAIEYPYNSVISGTWTFDRFSEIVKSGYADLNGDGKTSIDADQFGYITSWWGGPIQVLYCANERIANKDTDDIPYISLYNDRTVEIYQRFFDLFKTGTCYLEQTDGGPLTNEAFKMGRALFIEAGFGNIVSFRDMDIDFGVIPWPKYDESIDKYYGKVDASCSLFVVPIVAGDPARTSVILEALACEGYKSVIPIYYNVALTTKYARDDESADMLDIIKQGKIYDLGYYCNAVGELSSTGYNLSKMPSPDFASFYAKNEKAAIKALEKLVKAYLD
jgi:ABC-type glycerol-3-phosphate transport system substrate-binding protein